MSILAVALGVAGCGAPPDGTSTAGIRFSGARTGSAPFTNRVSYWLEEADRSLTLLPANVADDAGSAMLRVDLGHAGEPRTGAFRDGVDGAGCFVIFEYLGGRPAWTTGSPGTPGNCSFEFASVRLISEEPGARGRTRRYEVHGSFRGTLSPGAGASGTIEVSGTF